MRKALLATIVFLSFGLICKAQWTASGTNIYNSNTGNVGIGTSTPDANLHIMASSNSVYNLHIKNGGNTATGVLINGGNTNSDASLLRISDYTDTRPYFTVTDGNSYFQNGKVGISTANPQNTLDLGIATGGHGITWGGSIGTANYNTIYSSLSTAGLVLASGFTGTTSGADSYVSSYGSLISRAGIRLNPFGAAAGSIQFFTDAASANTIGTAVTPTEVMRIVSTGNVGIGTTTPDQKLSVNGTIHSKSVLVDLSGWSDFVFKPTYYLRPLAEVKAYIDQQHHLPEVPSEQEMIKSGLDVSAMNKILMQKVEELTLYLIEKDKQLEEQNIKLNRLADQSAELKSQQEQINNLNRQLQSLIKAKTKP